MKKIIRIAFCFYFLCLGLSEVNAQCTNPVTESLAYPISQTNTVLMEYCPNAGETMEMFLSNIGIETCCDLLEVYQGASGSNNTGTLVTSYGNSGNNPTTDYLIATLADECFILVITSDGSVNGGLDVDACPLPSPTCTSCAVSTCPIEDVIGTTEAALPNGYPAGGTLISPPLTTVGESATVCATFTIPAGITGFVGLDAFLSNIDAGDDGSTGFSPTFELFDSGCAPITSDGNSPLFNLPTYTIGGSVTAGSTYNACVTFDITGAGPGDLFTAIQFGVWGEVVIPPPLATCAGDGPNISICYDDGDNTAEVILQEICPDVAGGTVTINVNAGTIEACCDELFVYSGVSGSGNTGTLLGTFGQGGTHGDFGANNEIFTSLVADDCIIFGVIADGSVSCEGNGSQAPIVASCPLPECGEDCTNPNCNMAAYIDPALDVIIDNCVNTQPADVGGCVSDVLDTDGGCNILQTPLLPDADPATTATFCSTFTPAVSTSVEFIHIPTNTSTTGTTPTDECDLQVVDVVINEQLAGGTCGTDIITNQDATLPGSFSTGAVGNFFTVDDLMIGTTYSFCITYDVSAITADCINFAGACLGVQEILCDATNFDVDNSMGCSETAINAPTTDAVNCTDLSSFIIPDQDADGVDDILSGLFVALATTGGTDLQDNFGTFPNVSSAGATTVADYVANNGNATILALGTCASGLTFDLINNTCLPKSIDVVIAPIEVIFQNDGTNAAPTFGPILGLLNPPAECDATEMATITVYPSQPIATIDNSSVCSAGTATLTVGYDTDATPDGVIDVTCFTQAYTASANQTCAPIMNATTEAAVTVATLETELQAPAAAACYTEITVDVTVYPEALTVEITDDGSTCGTPSAQLQNAAGLICGTAQTGTTCVNDGDMFSYNFTSDAIITALAGAPAACAAPTGLSGTIACAGCSSPPCTLMSSACDACDDPGQVTYTANASNPTADNNGTAMIDSGGGTAVFDQATGEGTLTIAGGVSNTFAVGFLAIENLPFTSCDDIISACYTADINVISGNIPFEIDFRIESGGFGGPTLDFGTGTANDIDGTGVCSIGGSIPAFAGAPTPTDLNDFFDNGGVYNLVIAIQTFAPSNQGAEATVLEFSNLNLDICYTPQATCPTTDFVAPATPESLCDGGTPTLPMAGGTDFTITDAAGTQLGGMMWFDGTDPTTANPYTAGATAHSGSCTVDAATTVYAFVQCDSDLDGVFDLTAGCDSWVQVATHAFEVYPDPANFAISITPSTGCGVAPVIMDSTCPTLTSAAYMSSGPADGCDTDADGTNDIVTDTYVWVQTLPAFNATAPAACAITDQSGSEVVAGCEDPGLCIAGPACTLVLQAEAVVCSSFQVGVNDMYTVNIPFDNGTEGAPGAGNYTITTTGIVSGDNPMTAASGTIIITFTEGTAYSYQIQGLSGSGVNETCDFTVAGASPVCEECECNNGTLVPGN